MLLIATLIVPLAGALALALVPSWPERAARVFGTVVAAVPLALLAVLWARFDPSGPLFQHVVDLPWIPALGAGFRLGVDGIALPLASLAALLFVVAVAYPMDHRGRAREYVAWMLFLECVSIGFFAALDLLLFYVFFDLSLVGMYFLIGIWGHEGRERAALKFLLFTLAGSLVMLLGILSLALSADPLTFDMRTLVATQPLAGAGARAGLTLLALMFGLAVKTPLVPVHTWLPDAHVEAPAPASAILAGVLLKMGTYGMIRVPYAMMGATFTRYAPVVAIVAVVSIVYGAFVSLGQQHIKRRIAYTSITHMGYTALGIGIAASVAAVRPEARRLALTGATLEMVAHGLITGALFLVAGSIFQRGESFAMDGYGGLASRAPRLTVLAVAAAFASLGLPGFVGFVAEFQIFSGAVVIAPWLAGIGLVGVLVTAAVFLTLLQAVFFGAPSDRTRGMGDIGLVESAALSVLMGLALVIGLAPAFVLRLIDAASAVWIGAG